MSTIQKKVIPINLPFRILTIDGGGVRGIFPAHILAKLTALLSRHPADTFDLIVGTSTGSIIAAAAATNFSLDRLVQLYADHARDIFSPRFGSFGGMVRSAYSSIPLRGLLNEVFDTKTMSAARTRLMLPSTDISNGNVFVTKSPYLSDFVRDGETLIADAVLASCSAPSFFDPTKVKEYLLADGGLWANNPSMVAYVEAVGKLGVAEADIRLLSLGTGTGHQYYDVGIAASKSWGLGTGWQGRQLVNLIFNLQARSATNMATLLLKDRYLRISFDESGNLPMDNPADIARLRAKADESFTYRSNDMKNFLGL